MYQILVYGDSLSWGIIPDTRNRLRFQQRWPGVMESALLRAGQSVRVIEDCLNGRRTVLEDPFKAGRKGISSIQQCVEANSPLSIVLLILGTNDFQSMHQFNAWHCAQGIASIINAIRQTPIEPGMLIPEILVVAPPPIQKAKGIMAPRFQNAENKAKGLNSAMQLVAEESGCHFFDAGTVTNTSQIDGVHLDLEQHNALGLAMARRVHLILIGKIQKAII